jgi:hypothetical protein
MGERAYRLTKGVVLFLIGTVAIWVLSARHWRLLGSIAQMRTMPHDWALMWITNITQHLPEVTLSDQPSRVLTSHIMRDDENKAGDRFVVLIVALVILAAVVLAALLLFSHNEGLVRCREKFVLTPEDRGANPSVIAQTSKSVSSAPVGDCGLIWHLYARATRLDTADG